MNDLQRTPQWYADRLGKLTGSKIADATATEGTSRDNYKAELVTERLTGVTAERYVTKAMQNGIDREASAVVTYECERNVAVELVGFVPHPRIAMAGCSPDGLVGTDGTISIKCPILANHHAALNGRPVNGSHIKQLQWELACTGRQWCDFVSYNPLMPVDLQIEIRPFKRDDKLIEKLERDGEKFLKEVADDYQRMLDLATSRRTKKPLSSALLSQLAASVRAI